jgi:hypothetical protein
MAKGRPELMMGYGGIKRPAPAPKPSSSGQELVNIFRGQANLRTQKKKTKAKKKRNA